VVEPELLSISMTDKLLVIVGVTGNQVRLLSLQPLPSSLPSPAPGGRYRRGWRGKTSYSHTNQGSSVAKVFLDLPGWKIRGVTRDPSQAAAKALAERGVEIVRGDVNDIDSINVVFQGANVIFGNTVFPSNYIRPVAADLARLRPGQTLREWCYELEYIQGKNIADAAASVDGLELFIWSSLSAASKWSNGKYRGVYHFDSKADVVEYIRRELPALAQKMAILQMGLFINNWRWGEAAVPWSKVRASLSSNLYFMICSSQIRYFQQPDGSFRLTIPGSGDVPIPLVIPSDTGYYVRAIAQAPNPAGLNVLAFSKRLTWSEYVKLWSSIIGIPATFARTSVAEHDKLAPGGYGEEMAEMYAYALEFGYDGSDPSVTYAQDVSDPSPLPNLHNCCYFFFVGLLKVADMCVSFSAHSSWVPICMKLPAWKST
jgi:hypothetical protein